MSGVCSFIQRKDVKDRLREEFAKPNVSRNKELLAPPLTRNHSLVGIAFDYLLRFQVEKINRDVSVISHPWEAERLLEDFPREAQEPDHPANKLYEDVKSLLEKAKARKDEFMEKKGNDFDDSLIKAAITLSKFHSIRHSSNVGESFKHLLEIDPLDMEDLRNLGSAIDPTLFKAKKCCVIGPVFNESPFTNSPEADLVIDDMLIDIKTTKDPKFWRDHFNQLMVYYSLHKMVGMKDVPEDLEINKVGVYFSRFGRLDMISLDEVINENRFSSYIKWLEKTVRMG